MMITGCRSSPPEGRCFQATSPPFSSWWVGTVRMMMARCFQVIPIRLEATIYRIAWSRSLDDPCHALAWAACSLTSMTSDLFFLVWSWLQLLQLSGVPVSTATAQFSIKLGSDPLFRVGRDPEELVDLERRKVMQGKRWGLCRATGRSRMPGWLACLLACEYLPPCRLPPGTCILLCTNYSHRNIIAPLACWWALRIPEKHTGVV